jgi:hypothetical protein
LYFCGKDAFLNTILYKKRLCFAGFCFYQKLQVPILPFSSSEVADFFCVNGSSLGQKFKLCEDKWLKLSCPDKKEVVFTAVLE